ncbi:MAG: hypothetical protein KC646_14945 [Candidatus Cloacimonetes bacterium]|nr:hypothetical protein [Candidatus Cloacimonadota bacterium]
MKRQSKGFTVLELTIIVGIIGLIFSIVFGSTSSTKKKSSQMVEKGMALSMIKRVFKAIQQEMKQSEEIIIPKINDNSKYLLLKSKSQIPVLLGFDLKTGLFKTKNGTKTLLVKTSQQKFDLSYIRFIAKSKSQVELYLKVRMKKPDGALVEFFDVFNL